MRVLIVDDEVNLRFAIERRLRKDGVDAQSAATVRQAIERLRAAPVDVVITDLKMPGGDGSSLLEWIGSYAPSTQAIVVSAFVTDDVLADYADLTNVQILEKPVDLELLVAKVLEIGPRKGFFGTGVEVELFDYVQMVALSGRDKLLQVDSPMGSGRVWFEHGDVVHVEHGGETGERAFYKLLAVGRGSFKEVLFREPPTRTVHRSSTHLLMEAARQADEGILGEDVELGEDETEAAPPPPRPAPARDEPSFGPPGLPVDDDDDEQLLLPADDDAVDPLLDVDEELVLPADDDDDAFVAPPQPATPPPPQVPSPRRPAPAAAKVESVGVPQPVERVDSSIEDLAAISTTSTAIFDDPEARDVLLGQFWQYPGVNGVAVISSTGKVLAEDMREHAALLTLAGFYMRGAARVARALNYNVFDGVIARSIDGQQMLLVGMGATSAVLSIEIGEDPEAIRDAILGLD
jgi:CheY-like chemotaxis protein